MITDPEWFYSALAQSTAAIVALIGAVYLVRIVDHIEENVLSHKSIAVGIKELCNDVQVSFDQHEEGIEHYRTQISHVEKAKADGAATYQKVYFRGDGTTDNAQLQCDILIQEYHNLVTQHTVALEACRNHLPSPFTWKHLKQWWERLDEYCERNNNSHFLGTLNSYRNSFKTRIDLTRTFTKRAQRWDYVFVSFIVIWLFVSGVIWPLYLLTVSKFQVGILTCGSLGLFGFIVYLISQLRSLWKLGEFAVGDDEPDDF